MILIDPTLKPLLPSKKLDEFLKLEGEVFRNVKARKTQRILINNKPYFIKQHFGIGWKEIFKNLLQGKLPILNASNEWLAITKLKQLNIPTMNAVGFGIQGINPATQKSFLLTEEIENIISLEDLVKTWRNEPPSFKFKKDLIFELARIAQTIHDAGINHRDFYLCHFLLDQNSKNSPKLFLIDLHRAQIRKRIPVRWIIKDLAGLYFSSKDIGLTSRDYYRFVKHYRQRGLRTILQNESNFWKKVTTRGEQICEK